MKRYLYLALLAGMLFVMNSCITEPEYPHYEPWLCSINANGTGFRKIKKVDGYFGTTGFWDIYMTKDNRIIFYGESLWISETDSIKPVKITPDNLTLFSKPQLDFTRDGETAYFAASRDIYKLKLSTNEVFKLTETPADYYWAEPMLSDNERFVTMRGYWGKDSTQTVYSFIDLTDNSLHNVFATNYVAAPYKGKIMEGSSKFLLENKHGFGSISLIDSTYTLHNPYLASYKNMFETSSDQRYIVTKHEHSGKTYAKAIDLQSYTQYELGYVNEHHSRSPIKVCKDTNLVFFFDDQCIYRYDLGTHRKSNVIQPNAQVGVIMFAPTWDGSKVYFYAYISLK